MHDPVSSTTPCIWIRPAPISSGFLCIDGAGAWLGG